MCCKVLKILFSSHFLSRGIQYLREFALVNLTTDPEKHMFVSAMKTERQNTWPDLGQEVWFQERQTLTTVKHRKQS